MHFFSKKAVSFIKQISKLFWTFLFGNCSKILKSGSWGFAQTSLFFRDKWDCVKFVDISLHFEHFSQWNFYANDLTFWTSANESTVFKTYKC